MLPVDRQGESKQTFILAKDKSFLRKGPGYSVWVGDVFSGFRQCQSSGFGGVCFVRCVLLGEVPSPPTLRDIT